MTCSSGQLNVVFEITTDNYPSDLSYELTGGNQYDSGGFTVAYSTETFSWCLEQDECYTFSIEDSYGDGMLSGGYSLYVDGVNIMTYTGFDDKYGKSELFGNGCTGPAPTPSAPTPSAPVPFPTYTLSPTWSEYDNRSSINYRYIAMLAVPMALWGGMSYWKMRQTRLSSPSNDEPFYSGNINPTPDNYSSNYNNNNNNDINNDNNQGLFRLETITPMEVPESTYSTSLSPSYPTISTQSNHDEGIKEKSGFKSMFDEMKQSL